MSRCAIIIFLTGITATAAAAPFNKNTKSINGAISWSKMQYDGQDAGTLIMAAPSAGYFVTKNFALHGSINMTRFSFDGKSQTTGTVGFGIKYYRELKWDAGYAGCNLNFENIEFADSFMLEIGFLKALDKNIFLDLGSDYAFGVGDNKMSNLTLGVGIALFL